MLFTLIGQQLGWAQATPPALTFNHAAICVHDLKASTNFYKSVLALEEIPKPFNDGIHTWFKIGPQLQLHMIQRGCAVVPEKNVHLCFSIAAWPYPCYILPSPTHVTPKNLLAGAIFISAEVRPNRILLTKELKGRMLEAAAFFFKLSRRRTVHISGKSPP